MLYRPGRFAYPEKAAAELARSRGFGTLVSVHAGEPYFSHIPLLVDVEGERIVALRGHLARGNPHVEALLAQPRASVIFNGPDAYVSAQWYTPGNPAAPSWNYVVVHVTGPVTLARDASETSAIIDELVRVNEARLPRQWDLAGYSPERRARLLPHIIGFTLEAREVEPKFKLNQHYADADKIGAARGLHEVGTDAARQIAEYMLSTVSESGTAAGADVAQDLGPAPKRARSPEHQQ